MGSKKLRQKPGRQNDLAQDAVDHPGRADVVPVDVGQRLLGLGPRVALGYVAADREERYQDVHGHVRVLVHQAVELQRHKLRILDLEPRRKINSFPRLVLKVSW